VLGTLKDKSRLVLVAGTGYFFLVGSLVVLLAVKNGELLMMFD